jgi:hypothetical protein
LGVRGILKTGVQVEHPAPRPGKTQRKLLWALETEIPIDDGEDQNIIAVGRWNFVVNPSREFPSFLLHLEE